MSEAGAGRPFISVKFTPMGRVHRFLLPEFDFDGAPRPGEQVVVRANGGESLAAVVRGIPPVLERRPPSPASSDVVVRRATDDDLGARRKARERERLAHQFCLLKVRERQLPLKLARVEQAMDASRLVFYFTADGRVDFRELVRDLAAEFKARIEMRQIGVRDEARMLGGYGSCGRPLCCTTWLQSFEPVSIKMAKQQKLSLNPSKLSGLCGRLKCCLRYELPNATGEQFAGCADEGTCGGHCRGDAACGDDGCGSCHRS
jgi:cell fate regulator YaaT (PSP1 superfamily)